MIMVFISCEKHAEPEIFLIPDNYTGAIVIVFDQDNGEKRLYKDKKRLYEIPETGVLYTKFSRPEGTLKQEFYYKNDLSNKIESILLEKETSPNLSYVLDEYGGQSSLLPKEGISEGETKSYSELKWMYFTIGKTSSNREILRGKANSLIDKIVKIYPDKIK